MTKHQWTCPNCETPNVLVYDDTQDGQHTLNCGECGAPGFFEPVSQSVILTHIPDQPLVTSTCAVPNYPVWRV